MGYIEEEKEQIIKELLESNKIKVGQLIDYAYFLNLYKSYENRIGEKEFAQILGITYSNHNHIKNNGTRARVLKDMKKQMSEEEKEQIIKELLEGSKLKPGQSIDYAYFLSLYKPYKNQMEETEFAQILGISYTNYTTIKSNLKQRAKILKDRKKHVNKEEKEQILKELLEGNKVKPNQLIDYKYFLDLYKPYIDQIEEKEFAEILGITYINHNSMKNQQRRARVLKDMKKQMTEEEKEQIIKELLEGSKLKPGQSIDYAYFLSLYKPYKNQMKETEFAEILGITYISHNNIKNQQRRARVLKDMKKQMTEEEKEQIIKELLEGNKVKPNQLIDYKYFLDLYKPYIDQIEEKEFAEILGITYFNHNSMKNQQRRARVLKDMKKQMTEEEKEQIIKELLEGSKLKPGQSIDYAYLLELYKPYKNQIEEIEFAEILGIGYGNYNNIKNQEKKVRAQDYREKNKIDRVRYILKKEARYYTKEEIEEMSKKYDIDKETIIRDVCGAGKDKNTLHNLMVLEEKGQIWIGETKCSKKFANIHSETILQNAMRLSAKLCSRYGCRNKQQDIASEAIVYILEKCGDIDKNFNDKENEAKELIIARIFMFIKYSYFKNLKKPKVDTLYRKFTYKGDQEETNIFDRGIEGETQNVQEEVEQKVLEDIRNRQNVNPEDACIELLMRNLEEGFSREEAIAKTGKMLGISPEKMLKALQKYMIEQKRVKETKERRICFRRIIIYKKFP